MWLTGVKYGGIWMLYMGVASSYLPSQIVHSWDSDEYDYLLLWGH